MTCSIAAGHVYQPPGSYDSASDPIHGPVDDVYLLLDTLFRPHARPLLAIEAHGVRLVHEGKRPKLVGHDTEVTQLLKGADGGSLGVHVNRVVARWRRSSW